MYILLNTVFGTPLEATFTPEQLPVVIGRADEADVVVDDRWVSRVHCELSLIDGQLFVRDLESKHGTYVNERCINCEAIQAGDRLEIGLTTFLVQMQPAVSSTTNDQAT